MNHDVATIAELFSTGKFADVYDYLSSDIVWSVIGEDTVTGKKAVIEHCQRVATYFESIKTDFATNEVITTDNKVIVMGTAKFIVKGQAESLISACDIYEFGADNKIRSIISYCISIKDEADK